MLLSNSSGLRSLAIGFFIYLMQSVSIKPAQNIRFCTFHVSHLLFFFCSVLTEEVHARYKDIIQSEYDRVIDQCMEEVNRVKVC